MANSFDGKEGGVITLTVGADLTERFRTNFPTQAKARFFGKDILKTILAQNGCMGIRMYFGQDSDSKLNLVICGADAQTNDMLDVIADLSICCPQMCSTTNDLNS